MKFLLKLYATCFGVGYFPIAPGTLTSFIIVLLYKFSFFQIERPYYLLLLLAVFSVGVLASSSYSTDKKKKDPGSIVVDEAAGQLLVLFGLNPDWPLLLLSFGLFRFFDIVKPFPIRRIEDFPKGWGIMLDDIFAAVYAGIIINGYLLLK